MDYKKIVEDLSSVFKTEAQAADYAWLVFLYGLNLVNNILFKLHTDKDKPITIPPRYKVVYGDVVAYYNQYYGGKKDGQTKK
jgi:hypothetical protein